MGSIVKEYRVNQQIRAREVRLIGEEGEQLGIIPLFQALKIAREKDIDLVEVAPTSVPPVCRLLDYGKFRYAQAKKEREARKSRKVAEVREVRMRPRIDEHDFQLKTKKIKTFLEEGNKVKASVFFRGREATHPEIATNLLNKLFASLNQEASLEKSPSLEGRGMVMILAPAKKTKAASAIVKEKASA